MAFHIGRYGLIGKDWKKRQNPLLLELRFQVTQRTATGHSKWTLGDDRDSGHYTCGLLAGDSYCDDEQHQHWWTLGQKTSRMGHAPQRYGTLLSGLSWWATLPKLLRSGGLVMMALWCYAGMSPTGIKGRPPIDANRCNGTQLKPSCW